MKRRTKSVVGERSHRDMEEDWRAWENTKSIKREKKNKK